jgi:superoxide dismutase, Fe-Mn family
MSFQLPKLAYAYDALEPLFDAQTMEIHHAKHHQAYTDNLNKAIAGTELEGKTIEEICAQGSHIPAVRNNGGGFYNHNLFWEILSPGGSKNPIGKVAEELEKIGGIEKFQENFSIAATTRFGSGWAWLCKQADGSLSICSTPNQDNPLMPETGCGTPILGLDVWEHAYYLKYQNRRPDFIKAFFELINWNVVEAKYQG